jgi:hypothetical protein
VPGTAKYATVTLSNLSLGPGATSAAVAVRFQDAAGQQKGTQTPLGAGDTGPLTIPVGSASMVPSISIGTSSPPASASATGYVVFRDASNQIVGCVGPAFGPFLDQPFQISGRACTVAVLTADNSGVCGTYDEPMRGVFIDVTDTTTGSVVASGQPDPTGLFLIQGSLPVGDAISWQIARYGPDLNTAYWLDQEPPAGYAVPAVNPDTNTFTGDFVMVAPVEHNTREWLPADTSFWAKMLGFVTTGGVEARVLAAPDAAAAVAEAEAIVAAAGTGDVVVGGASSLLGVIGSGVLIGAFIADHVSSTLENHWADTAKLTILPAAPGVQPTVFTVPAGATITVDIPKGAEVRLDTGALVVTDTQIIDAGVPDTDPVPAPNPRPIQTGTPAAPKTSTGTATTPTTTLRCRSFLDFADCLGELLTPRKPLQTRITEVYDQLRDRHHLRLLRGRLPDAVRADARGPAGGPGHRARASVRHDDRRVERAGLPAVCDHPCPGHRGHARRVVLVSAREAAGPAGGGDVMREGERLAMLVGLRAAARLVLLRSRWADDPDADAVACACGCGGLSDGACVCGCDWPTVHPEAA